MKKYFTIDETIYEGDLIIDLQKVNDEIIPKPRKLGQGADKNIFFVNSGYEPVLKDYFPDVLQDRVDQVTGRNTPEINNYFDIASLLNNVPKVNSMIQANYSAEDQIELTGLRNQLDAIATQNSLRTAIVIKSEISNATNGIGFKEWKSDLFKNLIKKQLFHKTKISVSLFKLGDIISAYWEINQSNLSENIILNGETIPSSGSNNIYFGAPGTGKSHKLEHTLASVNEIQKERVTFHPEYDHASFVGAYKPVTDENDIIKYEFVPQAFTNIYIKAWQNPTLKYYLAIEEINRGNCAEIFGDIFQLLDRNSNYNITPSTDLKKYLEAELSAEGSEGISGGKMKLPPNLNLIATMNTSDQSLFPMDSAFKRRWDWKYIPICYDENNEDDSHSINPSFNYLVKLSDTENFKWIEFIKAVNLIIKDNPNLGMDKCVGNYFITPENAEISIQDFIHKAVFYLWNDVFKDEENVVFPENITYEDFFPIASNGIKNVKNMLKNLSMIPDTIVIETEAEPNEAAL